MKATAEAIEIDTGEKILAKSIIAKYLPAADWRKVVILITILGGGP